MGRRLALAPFALSVLFAGLAGLAACGPIAYVNEVTRRADDQIDAARRAEADKLAPYWWTRANEYRHKARENAARADFQGANRFGKLASDAAEQAIVDSKDPSKRPIDATAPEKGEGLAPAKGKGEGDGEVAPAPAPTPAKEPAPAKDDKAPAKDKDKAPAKGGGIAPAKEAP